MDHDDDEQHAAHDHDAAGAEGPMPSRRRVCIVGGGASGLLTAIHLVREAVAGGRAVHVDVIEERALLGVGVAYSTSDPQHLLNVPAGGMSALPDVPDHFTRWAVRKGYARGPLDFAPRAVYGSYLRRTLAGVETPSASTHAIRGRAIRVVPTAAGVDVHLDDGRRVVADEVVLATGSPQPSDPIAHRRLGDRYVVDAWAPGELTRAAGWRKVLVLGTGLSMIDVAIGLASSSGVHVQAISRRGLVPRIHRPGLAPRPLSLPEDVGLAELEAYVRAEIEETVAAGGDWRQVIDGMRPHTRRLWAGLAEDDRSHFLRELSRVWDVHRHRTAPAVGNRLEQLRREGRLTISRGRLLDARVAGDRVVVRYLPDGREPGSPPVVPFAVDGIVNTTGPGDAWADDNPVLRTLREDGYAQVDRWGLGLETDPAGAPIAPNADVLAGRLWSVGPLRRAAEWECTAVPDIRVHAQELGRAIVARAPRTSGAAAVSRARDLFGLPLSTSAESADRFSVGLTRLLTLDRGGEDAIREAVAIDPRFALGHAVLGLLGAESGQPAWNVERRLAAARRHARSATDRERSFIAVVAARSAGQESATRLADHLARWPRDGLALSMVLPTIAFSTDDASLDDVWSLLDQIAPAYGSDNWFVDGLRAFAHAEASAWPEAERLATAALDREPRGGHAAHALAHVFYETGRHRDGVVWLDGWLAGPGESQRFRSHFGWHAGLCELADGDRDALAGRFDRTVDDADGVRVLVDGVAFFLRCGVHGFDLGADRRARLASLAPQGVVAAPGSPFIAWHVALLHAVVEDDQGLVALGQYAATSARAEPASARGWQGVARLCDAFRATLRRDPESAVTSLSEVLARSRPMGGSPAQRELLEDLFLRACIDAGLASQAQRILSDRLGRRASAVDVRLLDRLRRPA
jgi:uncharacterized NAD(P)/FAD-binding protein YdhS